MATETAKPVPTQRRPQQPRLRTQALRDIGYNSITAAADSDVSTSGDELDGLTRADAEEDVGSLVGVSIGRAQTRLASPTTPAVEKAAAIAQSGGFFGDGNIVTVRERYELEDQLADRPAGGALKEQESDETIPPEGISTKEAVTSSPSQDTQHSTPQNQFSKAPKRSRAGNLRHSISSLGDVLSQHKRNSSLSEMSRRLQDFNLPSMPKTSSFLHHFSVSNLLPTFDGTSASKSEDGTNDDGSSSATAESGSNTCSTSPGARNDPSERPRVHQRRSTIASPVSALSPVQSTGRPSLDALSLAPSLGDDGRFVDIRQQVNSRKKAIADTIDDIHLPSLPSFGNINFGPTNRSKATYDQGTEAKTAPINVKPKPSSEKAANPHFYRALEDLTGDIVILGGYRGSVLKSAGPEARRLWVPLAVTMNLRKVNLEVGLDKEDEMTEESRVVPGKMLSHIGPIDISRRLLKRLRECPNARNGTLRVHDWGWDWRLSPSLISEKFRAFLSGLPCNQPGVEGSKKGATIIAHSLGGLITRHAVNRSPELFSKVVYAGVPQHAVNILGPLRHGDDVALNSRVLTAQVNFTIRTSFAFLPLSGQCFYDANTKEEIPVDFFDVEHWKEYRWSPVIARPLPTAEALNSTSRNSIVDSMADILSAKALRTAEKADAATSGRPAGMTPQMNEGHDSDAMIYPKDPKLAVTIPFPKAMSYLERTLAETKEFLQDLAYNPELESSYPHFALIYGKNIPTCRGAKVDGREGIKRSDAYDNLLFGSGDGVVLAKAAMLPDGYKSVKKGIVLSEKSHVSLLSDLDAVGRCLSALQNAKWKKDRPDPSLEHKKPL